MESTSNPTFVIYTEFEEKGSESVDEVILQTRKMKFYPGLDWRRMSRTNDDGTRFEDGKENPSDNIIEGLPS